MGGGYGMAGEYFTDVVLHISKNYYEHATEPRRQPKDVVAEWAL